MNRLCESVRRFYIDGYGIPKRFYSDVDLEHLVKAALITESEKTAIIREKLERVNPQDSDSASKPGQEVVSHAGV